MLVAGGAAAAPPLPAPASAAAARVSVKDFAFNPPTLTVTAGTTVTWTYDESATDPAPNCESLYLRSPAFSCPGHSVTSYDAGEFDSHIHRAEGFPFRHTFLRPGRYRYFCQVHGGSSPDTPLTQMDGEIVVLAAGSP